jgi:hypothetical protein
MLDVDGVVLGGGDSYGLGLGLLLHCFIMQRRSSIIQRCISFDASLKRPTGISSI